jgi:hypothetical protein
MKKLTIMLVLLVAVAFAASPSMLANSSSLSYVAPPTSENAHWQLTSSNVVGCVRDGETVYGSNDDATLSYDGTTIDLTSYDGAAIYIEYTQVAADANDYCTLRMNGGLPTHQFADAASATWITQIIPTSISNLLINFDWISDTTGFGTGFKMTSLMVVGANYGDGTYTNVFDWNSDMGLTHETHDVSPMGTIGLSCLSFHYTDNGWDWGWAIDNVVLDADGTEMFNEDFEATGWEQDQHGEDGLWVLGTTMFGGYPQPGSGQFFMCDSDGNGSWTYDAETFSPWVSVFGATAVTADFDSQFQDYAGRDHGLFGYYTFGGTGLFSEGWANLDDWTTSDSGTNIEESTWGFIKTL